VRYNGHSTANQAPIALLFIGSCCYVFFLSARRMTFSIQQTHINIPSNTPGVYFFEKGDLEEQVNFNICISSNPNLCMVHLCSYTTPFGEKLCTA